MKVLRFLLVLLTCFTAAGFAQSTATKSLTINVVGQFQIVTTSLPGAVGGQAYSQQLSAAGGVSPYTNWQVLAPKAGETGLPKGLSVSTQDATHGLISGTVDPAACTGANPCAFSFTVQASDSSGQVGFLKVEGMTTAKLRK